MADMNSEDMRGSSPAAASDFNEGSQNNDIKSEGPEEEFNQETENQQAKKRKKPSANNKKTSAEVLQRRKEGRMKAAATIANNLKKTGIGRFEEANGFKLTSVRQVPHINQKNYYTDYLKKDEQISFVRNRRAERLLALKKKTEMKKDGSDTGETKEGEKAATEEAEANNKKTVGAEEDEEEEDEEEENENEEISEEKSKQGFDTIVIHPGSSNIRIGRATDAYPRTVPTVVAFPNKEQITETEPKPRRQLVDGEVVFDEEFEEAKDTVTKDFKARMKYYKRRMLPNSRDTAANFNRRQEPEPIPDHNDPFRKDWIDPKDPNYSDKKCFVGEDALNLPICEGMNSFKLRYPIVNGTFNESGDYGSPQEILGDLTAIIFDTLSKLDVRRLQLSTMKAILVIPDLYDKMYVETWCDLILKQIGFSRVGVIQESVLATFGAGATTACVIDVGAQQTSIACVDEGMVINDSRIVLNYGGDHVTEAFIKLLLQSHFPYREIDLSKRNTDWELAQTLKHNYVTFLDADIAIQLYNFYKRKPFQQTEKYEFKVYDEVMLAPLGLFYPELFQIKESNSTKCKKLFSPSLDQYSNMPNNPISKAQDNVLDRYVHSDLTDYDLLVNMLDERSQIRSSSTKSSKKNAEVSSSTVPLEKAIIESITNAGIASDFSKTSKLYDNLLVVGGGIAKIPSFDLILSDRINIWRPKFLSTSTLDDILEYVSGKKLKVDSARQQMIDEAKQKKVEKDQPIEEVVLSDEEMEKIEEENQLHLDLDYIDSISDKGSVLPVTVLPSPREFDPEILAWKGGSVYARLKVISEMWISQDEWDLLESRCLYYKSLFNY